MDFCVRHTTPVPEAGLLWVCHLFRCGRRRAQAFDRLHIFAATIVHRRRALLRLVMQPSRIHEGPQQSQSEQVLRHSQIVSRGSLDDLALRTRLFRALFVTPLRLRVVRVRPRAESFRRVIASEYHYLHVVLHPRALVARRIRVLRTSAIVARRFVRRDPADRDTDTVREIVAAGIGREQIDTGSHNSIGKPSQPRAVPRSMRMTTGGFFPSLCLCCPWHRGEAS